MNVGCCIGPSDMMTGATPGGATGILSDGTTTTTASIPFAQGLTAAGVVFLTALGLGIGIVAPTSLLHISIPVGGTVAPFTIDTASSLVNHIISLRDKTAAQDRVGGFNFLNGGGSAVGQLAYFSTNSSLPNVMRFISNGQETMRFDAAWNTVLPSGSRLGIGMTPVNILDVTLNQAATSKICGTNTNAGGSFFLQLNSNVAAFLSGACGSALGGTSYGGVTGNNQVILEAASASSMYIGATPAAPMIFCQNRVEKMRLDANGNLGIGMTPVNILDITQSLNSDVITKLVNPNGGGAARTIFMLNNGSTTGMLAHTGLNFTTSGIFRTDATILYGNGSNGITITTGLVQPIYFAISNVEKMQLTAGGYFKASSSGGYYGVGASFHELRAYLGGTQIAGFTHTHVTDPYGPFISFDSGTPNNATNYFLGCTDSATMRAKILSNGGIANFSANNVNLSDINAKAHYVVYDNAELDQLETAFTTVDWGKFKFKDQTHHDWNYGYSAQGVEKAFALSAPELVDETDLGADGFKGVYGTDLTNIGLALLSRALKRIGRLEGGVGKWVH